MKLPDPAYATFSVLAANNDPPLRLYVPLLRAWLPRLRKLQVCVPPDCVKAPLHVAYAFVVGHDQDAAAAEVVGAEATGGGYPN